MLHLQDCPPLLHPTHTQHAQALRTHTHTTCSGSPHRCVQASDGRARRRRSTAPGRTAACTSAPALGPPSPPHNTVVVCRGEGTGRSTAAHPAEAWCATPPLRPPVHAQGVAPATPSSTPAWGAPLRCRQQGRHQPLLLVVVAQTAVPSTAKGPHAPLRRHHHAVTLSARGHHDPRVTDLPGVHLREPLP